MVQALFGSTSFQNQSGDRLVSKVVGAAIAALFKRSEKIEANVRAETCSQAFAGKRRWFRFYRQRDVDVQWPPNCRHGTLCTGGVH